MVNLFVNTRYDHPEEDRLTNALMAVIQHSDCRLLSAFLGLVAGREITIDPEAEVSFDLQVHLSHSRPDARIRAPGLTVVIETKRGSELDDKQFLNHWDGLKLVTEPTILLALTSADQEPELVRQLRASKKNQFLTAAHIGWAQVLGLIDRLLSDFEEGCAARVLLEQLQEYLQHLGYYHFRGNIVDDLRDYGDAMIRLAHHQKTTQKQLFALLRMLEARISTQSGMPQLKWDIIRFSDPTSADDLEVNFDFLTAGVPGLSSANYRVLPVLHLNHGLRLHFYFTYAGRGLEWNKLISWLSAHQANITDDCGEFFRFGLLKPTVFHLNRTLRPDLTSRLFHGAEDARKEAGQLIGRFFFKIQRWVDAGLAATRANAEQRPS